MCCPPKKFTTTESLTKRRRQYKNCQKRQRPAIQEQRQNAARFQPAGFGNRGIARNQSITSHKSTFGLLRWEFNSKASCFERYIYRGCRPLPRYLVVWPNPTIAPTDNRSHLEDVFLFVRSLLAHQPPCRTGLDTGTTCGRVASNETVFAKSLPSGASENLLRRLLTHIPILPASRRTLLTPVSTSEIILRTPTFSPACNTSHAIDIRRHTDLGGGRRAASSHHPCTWDSSSHIQASMVVAEPRIQLFRKGKELAKRPMTS